jgi:serine protease Do
MAAREIYQKSGAAVVLILATDDGKSGSGGTGSIIGKDGSIITNGHVILNASGVPFKTIYVYLKPAKISGDNAEDLKQRFTVSVKAYSPPTALDLALLKIDGPPVNLPTVEFGDPDNVNIGDPVVAIGHPEQGGLWTLTTGTISTVIQNFDHIKGKHVFQTEASFNRGNSGGPLFDELGNMVGINTMIARKAADGLAITAVNFSLKSSVAVNWLKEQQMTLAYAKPGPQGGGAALAQNTPPAKAQAAETASPQAAGVDANGPEMNAPGAKATSAVADKGKTVPAAPPGKDIQKDVPKEVPKGAKIQTDKRPFNLDRLIADQMKDLEDMMSEMSGRTKKKLK